MIYLTGDLHGGIDSKKVFDWYQTNTITEDDYLIQLGDFGYIWENPGSPKYFAEQKKLCNWAKKKFTLLVVPGNHENYSEINKLPVEEKFGGKVRVLTPVNPYNGTSYKEIYFLERGEIYTIDNKTFLALGGAMSNDKEHRVQNITWWEEELWTYAQENFCIDNLDKHNWEVDYVIAHTCPIHIAKQLCNYKSTDPTSTFFTYLIEKLKFKHWYFGHFHVDKTIDNFTCSYHTVLKLEESV